MKIVLVEDEIRARMGIVRLLERERPRYVIVGEADNGVDGMRCIKEQKPDLVITDIRMPRMDGLQMLENLHACGLSPAVIVLSGYADFEYAKQAIRYGVFDYMLKPITADDLTEVLDRLYEKRIAPERSGGGQGDERTYSLIVSAVLDRIHKRYAEKITLEDFADRFHVTTAYISSLFSRETGEKFSVYLRRYRVDRAKELLGARECKIYEVAYRTGFDDVQYFCKVFKMQTGCSAKEYIRSIGAAEL